MNADMLDPPWRSRRRASLRGKPSTSDSITLRGKATLCPPRRGLWCSWNASDLIESISRERSPQLQPLPPDKQATLKVLYLAVQNVEEFCGRNVGIRGSRGIHCWAAISACPVASRA